MALQAVVVFAIGFGCALALAGGCLWLIVGAMTRVPYNVTSEPPQQLSGSMEGMKNASG